MDRSGCLRRPCFVVGLLLGFLGIFPGLREACAQGVSPDGAPLGPTRQAVAASALTLSRPAPADASPDVLIRYREFESEFVANFGRVSLGDEDPLRVLHDRLRVRLGGTPLYEWIQRGMVLYTRFKGYTEAEAGGFAMEVDVDDVAGGRVGVRVNRAFE